LNTITTETLAESKVTNPWPPTYLEYNPAEIPSWIRDVSKHWTIWCYEKSDKGKHRKYPFNPDTHETHEGKGSERLKNTTAYHIAQQVFAKHRKTGGAKKLWANETRTPLAGVQFLPTNADKVVCIDLDDCTDKIGTPNPECQQLLDAFTGAYIERSPSGRGIRIVIKSPEKFNGVRGSKKGAEAERFGCAGIELWTRDQLATITGNIIQVGDFEAVRCDKALLNLMNACGIKQDDSDVEKAERKAKAEKARKESANIPHAGNEDEANLVISALNAITNADDRDAWLRIGQCLHHWSKEHNQDGFSLWTKWSSKSDKFSEEEHRTKWDSDFKAEGNGKDPLTIASLFKMAQDLGWQHTGVPKTLADGFHSTDLGNARRLIQFAGDQIRYCHGLGWLVWNGSRWIQDADNKRIRRKAQEVSRRMRSFKAEGEAKIAILRHAEYSERSGAISNMIQEASAMAEVWVESKDLDTHPELLNTPNGMIDLKTGDLLAHDPSKLMTKMCGASYDSKAECPKFLDSLAMYMEDDQKMIEYIQTIAGLGLTGYAVEKVFFDYGSGANGKSTTRELFNKAMGDYCVTIPADTLAIERFNNSNAPEPQKVRLMGARTAICNEWDKNKTLDTTTLKRLASTGKISARTLNKEPVEWTPTHTLFIQSNDQPKVILENEGERRRVRIIPWTYTIPQEKRDSTMTDKLFREEASGILRWIVQGAVRYLALRERGEEIPTPEKATLATTSFIDKCDPFKGFIEECCDQAGNLEDSSNGLYECFEGFCDENGLAKLNRRAFKARMLTIGIESHRTNAGVMYRGIARKQ